MAPASADDLALAITLADAADALTMAGYHSSDLVVHTKPDLTPVTEVDQAVEQALRDMLAVQRPDDAVIGEEYGGDSAAGRRWVIDPIDGTKNYVRGVPVWATLIALIDDTDEITVGVVSAPALQRRWWAATGHGAFTQGPEDTESRRITVSEVRDLADASVSVSDPIGWPDGSLDRLHQATWRLRAYGDFWSHLLVAEGAVDIAAEPELNLWDVAALVPIVVEAGGRITSFHGHPTLDSALTTNGHLHDAVIDLLH